MRSLGTALWQQLNIVTAFPRRLTAFWQFPDIVTANPGGLDCSRTGLWQLPNIVTANSMGLTALWQLPDKVTANPGGLTALWQLNESIVIFWQVIFWVWLLHDSSVTAASYCDSSSKGGWLLHDSCHFRKLKFSMTGSWYCESQSMGLNCSVDLLWQLEVMLSLLLEPSECTGVMGFSQRSSSFRFLSWERLAWWN